MDILLSQWTVNGNAGQPSSVPSVLKKQDERRLLIVDSYRAHITKEQGEYRCCEKEFHEEGVAEGVMPS